MEKQKPFMDNFPPKKPSNKKKGLFYFDAENESLWVAKQESWFGKTLNFANPLAYIMVMLGILFFVLLTRLV